MIDPQQRESHVQTSALDSQHLYLPLNGNYIMIIGFSVIYKQLLPETTIFHLKYPTFMAKHFRFKLLPIFLTCTMTLSQLLWFHNLSQFLFIWITFFTTWIYLRFYQKLPLHTISNPSDSTSIQQDTKGDASDTFQLIYFFPDLFKPILRPVFNMIYFIICEKFHMIDPFLDQDVELGNSIAVNRGAHPVPSQDEIRRQQLALHVLQERMANS